MILKGQNLRIYEYASQGQYKVIAQATSCTATLTGNTEDASHKDIVGNATMSSIVSKSWQVQAESLNVLDMTSLLTKIKNREKLQIEFDEASTTDNQTELKAAFARRGEAYISDITFSFNNRENSTKSITFMGTDALSKVPSQTPGTSVIPVSTSLTKGQFVCLFLGNDASATPSKVIGLSTSLWTFLTTSQVMHLCVAVIISPVVWRLRISQALKISLKQAHLLSLKLPT